MSHISQKDGAGITRRVESCGIVFYLTVNFRDGQPLGILIKSEKVGATIRGFLYVTALLISMLLERGEKWELISKKLKYLRFEPCTKESISLIHDLVLNVTELIDEFR